MKQIRNFSIIAHIDHGKSTLADRIIQFCGGLTEREMTNQILDSMEIERERGITIKAKNVSLKYLAQNKQTYQLNFIDTPGHVDFYYEVSRSLSACEGALLVVDATQGVEAQTLANCYNAMEQNIKVIPVLNKLDLPQAEPDRVIQEIETLIGIEAKNAIKISAKSGMGISNLLENIIYKIPVPDGDPDSPLQALIIDSWFDNYLGVVSLVRIKQGCLNVDDKIQMMSIGRIFSVDELGLFTPKKIPQKSLSCGQIGYLISGIKDIDSAPVGETITHAKRPAQNPLPGLKVVQPKVFAGMFPIEANDYKIFREALQKLKLSESALFFQPEVSQALGFGFRCGFLGMLHMEIVQERLEREYELDLITTAPTVIYEVVTKQKEVILVDNPSKLPNLYQIEVMREPIVSANIIVPQEFVGNIITLCVEKRGVQKQMQYFNNQVSLVYEIPMNEVVLDFYDRLKSCSRGYASLDYEFIRFQESDLVKIDILINGDKVDVLTFITHRDRAVIKGREIVGKLKELIPKQMFEVAIQAAIGSNIIARTNVKAMRKNVTAKCYGGDVTRKKKLIEKQKEGKRRMKNIGKVNIPQDAFLALLKTDKESK